MLHLEVLIFKLCAIDWEWSSTIPSDKVSALNHELWDSGVPWVRWAGEIISWFFIFLVEITKGYRSRIWGGLHDKGELRSVWYYRSHIAYTLYQECQQNSGDGFCRGETLPVESSLLIALRHRVDSKSSTQSANTASSFHPLISHWARRGIMMQEEHTGARLYIIA